MFFLSKVMVVGSLITGSSGISAYLIPYQFRKENLTALFQTSNSSYESTNSETFENKEEEKLKKLNPLHESLEVARNNARDLQKLKYELMTKRFESIMKSEEKLIDFYKKHIEVFKRMDDISSRVNKQSLDKAQKISELKILGYSTNLLEQLKKVINDREDALSKFICAIENGNQKDQIESKCGKLSPSWVLWDSQNKPLTNSGGGCSKDNLRMERVAKKLKRN